MANKKEEDNVIETATPAHGSDIKEEDQED